MSSRDISNEKYKDLSEVMSTIHKTKALDVGGATENIAVKIINFDTMSNNVLDNDKDNV